MNNPILPSDLNSSGLITERVIVGPVIGLVLRAEFVSCVFEGRIEDCSFHGELRNCTFKGPISLSNFRSLQHSKFEGEIGRAHV